MTFNPKSNLNIKNSNKIDINRKKSNKKILVDE